MDIEHACDGLVPEVLRLDATTVRPHSEVSLIFGSPLVRQCTLRQDVLHSEELAVVKPAEIECIV